MLRSKNEFLWAQWKAWEWRKADITRATGQEDGRAWAGGKGRQSPPGDVKTGKYVRSDRRVSKLTCLWIILVERELRSELTALSREACSM